MNNELVKVGKDAIVVWMRCYSSHLLWEISFFLVSWGGVRLSPLVTSFTYWLIVPAPDDRWWVWSSRWNKNWYGKLRKPAPAPYFPPQIPHDLTRARTPAAAVGKLRLNAWAMARHRLLGEIRDNHEKPQTGYIVSQLIFEPSTFRLLT
jgi:hypothetical protein